ncbi:MAG: KpsF/GutQ family sugar-phosphate isomerase [Pseudomonadales bacterium]|nr:KpsF/GutQ family sugar-phosphate isomerase [Pseudomonadales bacterium]
MSQQDFISSARRVIDLERQALDALLPELGESFMQACQLMLGCKGRIVVMGMGKSGHIAGKIAATLASTGSPAFFVHPGEASHGDLGMITRQDVVLALSNSGETAELLTLVPVLKRLGCPLISMTRSSGSTLARYADISLMTGQAQEACPLGLAPTSSTTASLALGDALAIALLEARGFTVEDFALSHPGGALGRQLLLKVDDIMHQGDQLPQVTEDTSLRDTLLVMTRQGMGMTAVVDAQGHLSGLFTDGDLRRTLDRQLDFTHTMIREVMTRNCRSISPGTLAAEALRIMEDLKINGLIVIDQEGHPLGALNMHDLLRAGVV